MAGPPDSGVSGGRRLYQEESKGFREGFVGDGCTAQLPISCALLRVSCLWAEAIRPNGSNSCPGFAQCGSRCASPSWSCGCDGRKLPAGLQTLFQPNTDLARHVVEPWNQLLWICRHIRNRVLRGAFPDF